ncbi:hypothetical protein [Marinobacter sp. ATCH36]|uniref:hypothetical protein n=1 Tax=Marinobacter sp. ATCH36 TaxID=2945106 RepID=UPI002021ADE3|nr:hypothetical protein [Marinobacter sp. ATCH36]MCL7944060.1 hypothetical protein [Marinobacter sp. ATCH36]
MTRKLSEYRIARDLAEALRKRLISSCIRDLQAMKDTLLAGEDSGLDNTWDEICVQQQREHSFSWHAYVAAMEAYIEQRVNQLQPYELDALWLRTQRGDDWDTELEEERESYPVFEDDVVVYLQDELLTAANDWSNARISRYLDRYYE